MTATSTSSENLTKSSSRSSNLYSVFKCTPLERNLSGSSREKLCRTETPSEIPIEIPRFPRDVLWKNGSLEETSEHSVLVKVNV